MFVGVVAMVAVVTSSTTAGLNVVHLQLNCRGVMGLVECNVGWRYVV